MSYLLFTINCSSFSCFYSFGRCVYWASETDRNARAAGPPTEWAEPPRNGGQGPQNCGRGSGRTGILKTGKWDVSSFSCLQCSCLLFAFGCAVRRAASLRSTSARSSLCKSCARRGVVVVSRPRVVMHRIILLSCLFYGCYFSSLMVFTRKQKLGRQKAESRPILRSTAEGGEQKLGATGASGKAGFWPLIPTADGHPRPLSRQIKLAN